VVYTQLLEQRVADAATLLFVGLLFTYRDSSRYIAPSVYTNNRNAF
jgi:hypothetical protein